MKIKKGLLKAKNAQGNWEQFPMICGKDGTDAEVTSSNIATALGYTPAKTGTIQMINSENNMTVSNLKSLDKGTYVLQNPVSFSIGENSTVSVNGLIKITKSGNDTLVYCFGDGSKYKLSNGANQQVAAETTENVGASFMTPFNNNTDTRVLIKNLQPGNYFMRISGNFYTEESLYTTMDTFAAIEKNKNDDGTHECYVNDIKYGHQFYYVLDQDGNITQYYGGTNDGYVKQYQIPQFDNQTQPEVGQVYAVSEVDENGYAFVTPTDVVKGVQVAGTDLTPDADGKVNVPVASATQKGVISASETYGLRLGSDGAMSIRNAYAGDIASRTSAYKAIVPTMLNTAVKAALTDSKRIGHNGDAELTDEEKGNACSVIGAERSAKWELIRTINGDGETRKFTVSDELVHLYYAVYVDENVAMPVLSVNAYISTTVSADSTRVLYHYMGASNQSYKRKSTGRCIKMGNMYTSELTSYISNTNGTTKQSVYFGDMNDIISDDNIHYVIFSGSSAIPLGCTIKVFGVRA